LKHVLEHHGTTAEQSRAQKEQSRANCRSFRTSKKARGDEAPTRRENATRVEFWTLRGENVYVALVENIPKNLTRVTVFRTGGGGEFRCTKVLRKTPTIRIMRTFD
jgi:hypothetical protein